MEKQTKRTMTRAESFAVAKWFDAMSEGYILAVRPEKAISDCVEELKIPPFSKGVLKALYADNEKPWPTAWGVRRKRTTNSGLSRILARQLLLVIDLLDAAGHTHPKIDREALKAILRHVPTSQKKTEAGEPHQQTLPVE